MSELDPQQYISNITPLSTNNTCTVTADTVDGSYMDFKISINSIEYSLGDLWKQSTYSQLEDALNALTVGGQQLGVFTVAGEPYDNAIGRITVVGTNTYDYIVIDYGTPFNVPFDCVTEILCNCLLIRIDKKDILSATGNTLYSNYAVYIDGFIDCDSITVSTTITESGYYCYCAKIEEITEVIPNIYYYKDDVLVTEVYSTYYNSTDTCLIDSDCCTDICKTTEYCISNTGNPLYNDIYDESGLHNGKPHWIGKINGLFIYYSIVLNQWCLSSSLDGPCLLSGKSPCPSVCPDLNGTYLNSGMCLTPTPTPTNNCNILDFQSFFDCEISNSPTPTPTPTQTPTNTPTPSSTNFCPIIAVVATINSSSPTPTPTPTITPTSYGPIIRPCHFYGDVTFNTVNDMINCPISKQFQDCFNGTMYYTPNNVTNPSGGNIEQFMVFKALVDGLTKCISYVGTTEQISGVNNIILNSGPYGYSNLNGCSSCVPNPNPTPTMTSTPTKTPSSTPTITSTPTMTPTPTKTSTPTITSTPTMTPTPTKTPSSTPTITSTPTMTPTPTKTPSSACSCVGGEVIIGTQTWACENTNISTYRDGTEIPEVTGATAWKNLTTGAWCYYNNNPANGSIYGKIYNWYAIAGIYDAASLANPALRKEFAPTGYNVPTTSNFSTMISLLGGFTIAGGKLKEVGTTHWNSPNTSATNSSCFTGLPSGLRVGADGSFMNLGITGEWWSSTTPAYDDIQGLVVYSNSAIAQIGTVDYNYGRTVRFIKN